MAWAKNDWTIGDQPDYSDLNDLANSIRTWGGNVNAGGYNLSNAGAISATGLAIGGAAVAGRSLSVRGASLSGLALHSTGTGASWFVDNRGNGDSPNDRLSFSIGGNDLLTVLSSGNTGIGNANPAYRLSVLGGFAHVGGYNTMVIPASHSEGGMILGWNRSGGGAEVNLYNAYSASLHVSSFLFTQKTGDATYTDLLELLANGGVRLPLLPSSSPGAGTKQLWYDPADGNRVKFAA